MPNGLLNFLMNSNYLQNYSMKNEDISENRWILGFSEIQDFHVKKKLNPPRIFLGVLRKGSKRIFDFDHVYGVLQPIAV